MSLLTLPLEVRYQIYEVVLTTKVLAFTSLGKNLLHGVCPLADRKFHMLAANANGNTNWCACSIHREQNERAGTQPRMPLLLTCRQIYSEVLYIIWSRNPVHIQMLTGQRDFKMLSRILSLIPSRAFESIRRLEISFLHGNLYPCHQVLDEEWFAKWEVLWGLIGDMKGLNRIQAWIAMDQNGHGRRGWNGNFMTPQQEGS